MSSLARALAFSSTLATLGWAFIGACGGHPLTTPHPSGGAGKGTGSAGTSPTGVGPGTGGTFVAGVAGMGVAGATIAGTGGSGGSPLPPACVMAHAQYDADRDNFAQIFGAVGCTTDSDCTAVAEPGPCGTGCGTIPLPASAVDAFQSVVMNDAIVCEGVCPPRMGMLCPNGQPPVCSGGRCTLGGYTGAAGAVGTSGGGGAGQGGAGGAPACGPCPASSCQVGYMSVVDPAISCCPICRPINCATVDCSQPSCPAGSHAEVPTGQCCAVCVMGFSKSCNDAQARYSMDRGAYIEKYSMEPCTLDTDCRLVIETNSCDTACYSALTVTTAGFYESNISSDAAACNAACPAPPRPPCVPQTPICSNGRCTSINARGLGLN